MLLVLLVLLTCPAAVSRTMHTIADPMPLCSAKQMSIAIVHSIVTINRYDRQRGSADTHLFVCFYLTTIKCVTFNVLIQAFKSKKNEQQ